MAVEVREDVPLEELLLAVQGELLGADGAHLPVALHVLLEAALLEVRWEDHLTQRAALVNAVGPGERNGDGKDRRNRVDINILTLFSHPIQDFLCLK